MESQCIYCESDLLNKVQKVRIKIRKIPFYFPYNSNIETKDDEDESFSNSLEEEKEASWELWKKSQKKGRKEW